MLARPTVPPQKLDEPTSSEVRFFKARGGAAREFEGLGLVAADGNDKPAAGGELLGQRRDVAAGSPVRWQDVELPNAFEALEARQAMERAFREEWNLPEVLAGVT